MALARLALKNLGERVVSPCWFSLVSQSLAERSLGSAKNQRWSSEILKGFAAKPEKSKGQEVAVEEADKKSKLSPRRKHRWGLWRKDNNDLVPAIHDFLPSGLGSALVQATENINKLLENLAPSRLLGRVKEQDNCYKLKYYMPGLSKEDLKITVEDGILRIKGEHKEEGEQDSDDEQWVAMSYGYYDTTILLPEDAKVDEIKAEMKDGVLNIVIPKSETPKKDVKKIKIK
ncbi:26.5 kDa heat shock protein, mitochondrial-like isoform X1 [Actinidia eriantha]|uniref:26.5 kDa heat shock protein, mitochondrial-like isoform X1 n=1 Tax=Actinidia eriantha TaxID=165200 RepID=UPI0025904943|nr:26.5 kDa heat shock protein, mitochondrial-like isoform X1 [Actinidia eriantha]